MALTGSDIWLATALAQVVWLGMVLVRRTDRVNASPMAFRSAVSFVHAARSTRLITRGTSTATRIAMTASTAIVSINVQPFRRRKSEIRNPKSEIARRDDFPPARRQAGSAEFIPPARARRAPAQFLDFFLAQTCSLPVSVRIVACRASFPERGCVRSTSRSTTVIPRATLCGWVFDHSRAPFWLRLGRAAPYRGFVIFVIRNELPGTTPCRLRRSRNPTLPLLHRMEERAG